MSAAIASTSSERPLRQCAPRLARCALFVLILLGLFLGPVQAAVHGEVKLSKQDGFARLSFHFDEQVGIEVAQRGAVLILSFAQPVDIDVEKLAASAPELIGAARRDPDGRAVRIALARKIKLNSIPAAEHFFLDLLPENWNGLMPGPPQEVVDELSRRAREAEQRLRESRAPDTSRQLLSGRVKVAVLPTFTRFIFDMPEGVEVASERRDDALTLRFNRPFRWEVGDARAAMPASVSGIEAEIDASSARVTFNVEASASLRSFRDGNLYMVDVDGRKAEAERAAAPLLPGIAAPQSVPADQPPPKENAKPSEAASPKPAAAKSAAVAGEAMPAAPAAMPAVAAQEPQAEPAAAAEADAAPVTPPPLPKPPPRPQVAQRPPADPYAAVAAGVREHGNALTLTFPFVTPAPAAVFQRGRVLWLVFDSEVPVDLGQLKGEVAGLRKAAFTRDPSGASVIRLTLDRPRLVSAAPDGMGWIVSIADTVTQPPLPLSLARSVVGRNRANIVIPFARAAKVHRLRDPDFGDSLIAITAPAPARGLLKEQTFLEVRALASAHGIGLQPIADDLQANIAPDNVLVSRPGGLALSATGVLTQQLAGSATTFDPQVWGYDRSAPFMEREAELIRAAADAPEGKRWQARLNLARFYIARERAAEAKGVLDVALAAPHSKEDVTGSILRSISELALQRPAEALKELSTPQIGKQQNAAIWRSVALVRQGKWAAARDGFKELDAALATLPVELQRIALMAALRAAVETRDVTLAARLTEEIETVGVAPQWQPELDVLLGRPQEELGHAKEALAKYRAAASSLDARAAAQGRLREIALRVAANDMTRNDAIVALETLTAIWRGDETETEGLYRLSSLYRQDGRFRDAFHTMRTAVLAHPNSDFTRKVQDEAAANFQELFLSGKGDALPPIEALGLFYDYRDLTPIGRLGDDMIRKLADRLISVDLLGQAAELLQHQVDKRLQGAARAQVAAKLATVYLMNRKPERALATLRATRDSDVANELRQHRLLIEARALSELGRQPLALEVVADLNSPEASRLRADVLWSAKRWREAAEEIERLYGERWRDFKPLAESERADILRAAIGYALAEEAIGLARLHEKYAAKMADGPDARAFNVVSSPIGTSGPEFQDVARRVGAADTLVTFLREIRARYEKDETKDAPQAAAPSAANAAQPEGKAPPPPKGGTPLRPDPMPTGTVRQQR
jgi:hypothetical protein